MRGIRSRGAVWERGQSDQEWIGAYIVAWTLLEKRRVGASGKSSIALYRAVPVSQSSHKGICSREASSMLLIDGTREGYERRCSGRIGWLNR